MKNLPPPTDPVEPLRALAVALVPYLRAELALAPHAEPSDRYVTQKTARAWGLSSRRFLDLVRRGELPASKDGRAVLVRVADLEAYLSRNRVTPRSANVETSSEPSAGADEATAWGLRAVGGRRR